jgi:citrate synthase
LRIAGEHAPLQPVPASAGNLQQVFDVTQKELVPGLAGVPAAESAISFIDGQQGVLAYRGHRIEVLAERSTFEETAWLLWYGRLPNEAELAAFRARLGELRALPPAVVRAIQAFPTTAHPMEALQASVALLGAAAEKPDLSNAASRDAGALRLLA